ncbi:hypothetical protein ACODUL_14210 [Stenotrophomonas maltophilia]
MLAPVLRPSIDFLHFKGINCMGQTGPDAQAPPAKVLFPLVGAFIVLPITALATMDLGPASGVIIMIFAGAGVVWQGAKKLKRDKT